MSNVLIEFTETTKNSAGETVRSKGDRLRVDERSAKSFLKKKVARKISEKDLAKPADTTEDQDPEQPDGQDPEQQPDPPAPGVA